MRKKEKGRKGRKELKVGEERRLEGLRERGDKRRREGRRKRDGSGRKRRERHTMKERKEKRMEREGKGDNRKREMLRRGCSIVSGTG